MCYARKVWIPRLAVAESFGLGRGRFTSRRNCRITALQSTRVSPSNTPGPSPWHKGDQEQMPRGMPPIYSPNHGQNPRLEVQRIHDVQGMPVVWGRGNIGIIYTDSAILCINDRDECGNILPDCLANCPRAFESRSCGPNQGTRTCSAYQPCQ